MGFGKNPKERDKQNKQTENPEELNLAESERWAYPVNLPASHGGELVVVGILERKIAVSH